MSKHFYKDVKLIKECKVPGCGVAYRPQRGSFFAKLGLCHKHRSDYYQQWYLHKYLPWFEKLTPDQQQELKDKRYEAWIDWVDKHKERRRKQALESYHRNKGKSTRKHRASVQNQTGQ